MEDPRDLPIVKARWILVGEDDEPRLKDRFLLGNPYVGSRFLALKDLGVSFARTCLCAKIFIYSTELYEQK